jgi:small-conductance mechanosensitive channel
MVFGAVLSTVYGNVHHGNFNRHIVSLLGVIVFVIFATAFLHVLTRTIHRHIALHKLGTARAASIQFLLRMFGYVAILLISLELLGISVEKLLFGGAVLGIILGVAAQQALANLFASIVLVISHPFAVGDVVTLTSGALGGKYEGTIIDIGLTHSRLAQDDGNIILLPNATVLAGAAIMPQMTPTQQ